MKLRTSRARARRVKGPRFSLRDCASCGKSVGPGAGVTDLYGNRRHKACLDKGSTK